MKYFGKIVISLKYQFLKKLIFYFIVIEKGIILDFKFSPNINIT